MISIIIPARNAQDTLPTLLNSLWEAHFVDREIIVVDDASTDATPHLAPHYGARVVRLPTPSGPAAARNAGAKIAQGEILLFLDSDVRLRPETLAYIASRFKAEPELACLVGIYSKRSLSEGIFPAYKALFNFFLFKDAADIESFETSCGAIRKTVFKEMGEFNTNYSGAEVEDYELGYRLGDKYKVVLDTRIQVDHHYPGFLRNARNFFNRGRLWFKLFLRRRRFDSAGGTTISQAAGTLAAAPLAAALVCAPFMGAGGYAALALCGAAYLLLNGPFFIYCAKEAGPFFALAAVAIHFANSLVVLAAVAAALFPCHGKAEGGQAG